MVSSLTVLVLSWHAGVYSGIREARDTVAQVAYNGIEPDTTGCVVRAEGTLIL